MKQFLYLDNDIVNSIIAQADQGFISEFSQETESGHEHLKNRAVNGITSGEIGGSIWKLANAAIKIDLQGTLGSEKSVHSSSRELITKTLHDAAFDMAYEKISPAKVEMGTIESDDYGEYVEIKRVFDVVDFEYLENIFSKGGLIELIKKSEKEKIEAVATEATSGLNRSQLRANGSQIKLKIKEAIATSSKQYDDIPDIISAIKQLIPYDRMLLSPDGYLIPLDDQYFRIDPKNLGFKYGGEITCVGMITNIIGIDTAPCDNKNVFATLQFTVNEVLRTILPTNENNLCIIHPIAVFYGE